MKTVQGSKKVFMVLTDRLLERIDTQAQKKTMSRSLLVRLAVDEYLKKMETGQDVA